MSEKIKKNLLISGPTSGELKLLESANPQDKSKKYVFTGCFTQCSSKRPGGRIVKNRNNRIYYDEEVLRHLGYLRDQIKENGYLAGELDHPDRFEVKLSEASHKITDLWYDPKTQMIMGKLELLDTPKGQITKQLVDAGLNLAVSSRSAGSVRPDSSVELDMIYTWDIVFTPGFKEAHLERVMESLNISSSMKQSLNESFSNVDKNDVITLNSEAKINEKAMKSMNTPINMNELTKPLCESEDEDKKDDAEVVLPEANLNPLEEDDKADEDKKDDSADTSSEKDNEKDEDKKSDDNLTDEDKKKRRGLIVDIKAQSKDEKSSASGKDAEENREDIVNIEGVEADKADDSKEEKEADKESGKDETDQKPEDSDEANESEDGVDECGDDVAECGDECKDGKCDGKDCDEDDKLPTDTDTKKTNASNKDLKDKVLNDCDGKCDDVKKQTEKDMDKIQKLLDKAAERKKIKESIYKFYPFTVSLSEENFGKFAALSVKDKNKVQKFIIENGIFNIRDINEQWVTPLKEDRRQLKNWLRLASDEDRRLFTQAPADVQDAIEESAKYVVIQNKKDADDFWEKTGLRQQNAARIMNESLSQRYRVQKKDDADDVDYTTLKAKELGYSVDYFKMLEDMY